MEDFEYFSGLKDSIVIGDENGAEAINNEIPLYTEWREHVSHQVYNFSSLAQVIRDSMKMHPSLNSHEHIRFSVEVPIESLRRDEYESTVDADMGDSSMSEVRPGPRCSI